jgi:hypothetical protein
VTLTENLNSFLYNVKRDQTNKPSASLSEK